MGSVGSGAEAARIFEGKLAIVTGSARSKLDLSSWGTPR